ncbi:transmembrane amino acid transporter protein-domain-containing protein [Mycena galopus ATCC 62051]|nr:transmembrane amino acid transporter protein-domain-containing protein [Mycena galopus ATCC 62051]
MSSPCKPVHISNPSSVDPAERVGVPGPCFSSTRGTSDIRLLRAGSTPPPNIRPRNISTPSLQPQISDHSPAPSHAGSFQGGMAALRPAPNNDSDAELNNINLDGLPDEEKARVLRRYLVSKDQREAESTLLSELEVPFGPTAVGSGSRSPHVQMGDTEPFPIHYHTPGADVTHGIYKWNADQRKLAARRRATSLVAPRAATPDPVFGHIHAPGGFRRNYVLMRANERGDEEPVILNNFIDFLYLYGHFAGEDLEEDDEDEEEQIVIPEQTENAPLLATRSVSRSMSLSRTRSRRTHLSAGTAHGNATVPQAALMLLKSFIGTGVLFLGKAFYNGGILFSSILFVFIALITLYSLLLLVYTKFVIPGSFGDIGGALYGPWMRYLILVSIFLLQFASGAVYTIFVSQNLQALVMGLTHCKHLIDVKYFIIAQTVVFLPLVLIRDLAKLSTAALVADAFIIVGLMYLFGSEISIVATRGFADVQLFNAKDFPLFVGVAVLSFEGVGLVIPIADAMREPHKFPKVLTGVILGLLVLLGAAGALAYLTFGADVQTVVLLNFDVESKMVQTVQLIYSIAIMLSVPLQLFPAIRIAENGLFMRSGKGDVRVKWTKNILRFGIVAGTALLSCVGAADFDKFVAFIGCFACAPLCYVYPAMLHYKACANTLRKKVADIAMILFGLGVAAYTTVQTVQLMLEPDNGGPPVFGNCRVVVPPS